MQYKCSSLQSYEEISPLGFFGLYFSSSLINQIKQAVNGFPTININIQLYKKTLIFIGLQHLYSK